MSICFGILNITTDSFSDGGSFLSKTEANSQVDRLIESGADWIEISGQSSNIHAQLVTEEEEWSRIQIPLPYLNERHCKISIDSFRPKVQALAIENGINCINDITGFTDPDARYLYQNITSSHPSLFYVVMHSHTLGIAKQASDLTPDNVFERVIHYFHDRKKELMSWGILEHQIYFDPGMGFFLGEDPEISFSILRDLDRMRIEFPNLMVSVSRKSFLANALGGLPIHEREFVTLTAEIHLLLKQVPWIRTHNVKKVKEAEAILKRLGLLPT